MNKHLKNNNGSALLIAVAILMIFTILGLTLMTLTTNGLAKNETRENIVQATDLADKGIEFIIADIQAKLQEFISSGNVNKSLFQAELLSIIQDNNLDCSNSGIEIPADNGLTKVCIDTKSIENAYLKKEDGTLILQELKRIVPIYSTGIVNNKEVTTSAKASVGTDAVPDQLRYAISSNNGGNIYLHGGIEIHGDIKTDNNLILSNRATWMLNNQPQWVPSVRTKLVPGPGSSTPKVIFSKENKAVYDLKRFEQYSDHISGNNLEKSNYYSKYSANTIQGQNDISNLFFNSPKISVITNTSLPQDTVEITQRIQNKYKDSSNKKSYTTNLHIYSESHETRNFKKQDVVFVSDTGTEQVQETYTYYEDVCIKKGQVRKWSFWKGYYYVWECIQWEQQERTGVRWTNQDTFKFGNMKIDNNSNNNKNKKNITLKGTYYVYGDLTIENVNLTADAIIYVQGKVDISESTIQGVDSNSTLIIFSNGNIDISNMSVDKGVGEASKIKGFFYTKQDMIMYGVGSHINLTGGISSRRLILTGVRGNSTNHSYLNADTQGEIKNGVAIQYPRLKIIYDQDLISTYTEFIRDEEEEFIKSISSPEIIERY